MPCPTTSTIIGLVPAVDVTHLPNLSRGIRFRSRVPMPVVEAVVHARVVAARRSNGAEQRARREMELLLAAVRPDLVDSSIGDYQDRMIRRSELRYHPGQLNHQPVAGVEHLREAMSWGRGVVLSFLHHGHYEGSLASVGRQMGPLHLLVDPLMLDPRGPSWLHAHINVACSTGNLPVDARLGSRACRELLAAGGIVAIAPDIPGSTPVNFLGRPRLGSAGVARVAYSVGAPVVVLNAVRRRGSLGVALGPTLRPEEHDNAESLLAAVLDAHESAVIAWPGGYDQPSMRWGQRSDTP